MFNIIRHWFHRYFSDPEAVLLFVLLVIIFGVIIIMGNILAPVIASIIISYFLQWWVNWFKKHKIPHVIAYSIVYTSFLSIFTVGLLILLPLMWKQLINLFNEMPVMIQNAKLMALNLIAGNAYFSEQQINALTATLMQDIQNWGRTVLSMSLSSIPGVIAWFVYLILVPLLVFFFLKDNSKLLTWFTGFLPKEHGILTRVYKEMDEQIGNYIRGKITEITIVGIATYIVFLYFDLRYRVLLAVLVGLSVVIPYVGAVVVTIPVLFVGYIQWGITAEYAYMCLWYFIVQALDGNLLVPFLFSEAVNLHPIAIIVAILVFGDIWGFWGVFFAIPLATLVKAVLNAWPRQGCKS
jgi:putative permease